MSMLTELKCIILLLLHSVFCNFLSKHRKLLILIFTYKVAYLRSIACVSVATLVTIIVILQLCTSTFLYLLE